MKTQIQLSSNKNSKHKNKKATRILGKQQFVFDSQKEAERFDELYLLLKAKKISNLVVQPEFLLCDTQRHNGVTYPKVKYVSDFKYIQNAKTIVEDVKSSHTARISTYRVKIKWFLSIYGNEIVFKEV